MADRDMQPVRIIVGNRLPVEMPRTDRDPAQDAQIPKSIGGDLLLIRRHHLGDRRRSRLERHEQETVPILQRHREEAQLVRLQAWIFVAVRDPDQPAVPGIAPRMIGTGKDFGAAAVSIDDPRAAVTAHV